MGKGKGKQSRHFNTKSQRAAYYSQEVRSHMLVARFQSVDDDDDSITGMNHHHRPPATNNTNHTTTKTISNNNNNNNRRRRRRVLTGALSSILRERAVFDRIEDQANRRRRAHQQTSNNNMNISNNLLSSSSYNSSNRYQQQRRQQTSVIINNVMTSTTTTTTTTVVPSLSHLCAVTLGRHFDEYSQAIDFEILYSILSTLNTHDLSTLSENIANITNEMLLLVGYHFHVVKLTLNGSPRRSPYAAAVDEDDTTSASLFDHENSYLTDEGLRAALTPRLIQQPVDSVETSWENLLVLYNDEDEDEYKGGEIMNNQLLGCGQLKSLSLNNTPRISLQGLKSCLRRLPSLKHLSLSYLFENENEPEFILLHDDHDNYNSRSYGGDALLDLLPCLERLSIIGMSWLTNHILDIFLMAHVLPLLRTNSLRSFELNVFDCPNVWLREGGDGYLHHLLTTEDQSLRSRFHIDVSAPSYNDNQLISSYQQHRYYNTRDESRSHHIRSSR